MEISVRDYEAKDEEQLSDLYLEEKYLLHILKSTKLYCAYTAVCEDQIVGMITAWTSDFHPNCTYFQILSYPYNQQMNVEKALLIKLEKHLTTKLSLQTSIWQTRSSLKLLYENNGFIETRKTYMPVLKIEEGDDASLKTNGVIKTLADISLDYHMINKLTQLVKNIYEQTHLDNPVAKLTLEDWQQMILADDVVMDGSLIYLNATETNVLAYSFLHDAEENETLELGWCGCEGQHIDLILQLVRSQVDYARKQGIQFMIGEFDSTSKYAMEVLRNIPFPPCEAWITYRKTRG
jgi:hypothetical protein